MIVEIGNIKTKLLGDPHLGRQFRNGVPLHRIGEREAFQQQYFRDHLLDCEGIDLHVNMGDLFDKPVVPYEIIMFAARAYRQAALINQDTTYFVLPGNHDLGHDTERVTAYEIFAELVEDLENVNVVTDCPRTFHREGTYLGFFPWHPTKTSVEVVQEFAYPHQLHAAFGHWDVVSFGKDDNLVPTSVLTCPIYTGHDHLRRDLEIDGVEVHVTGSMLPYTHAEDPDGKIYVTVTLDQLEGLDVTNKCVRVILQEGETLPTDLDCLQLTALRQKSEKEAVEVGFEAFDMKALFEDCFAEIAPPVKERVWGRFQELRSE